MIRHILGALIAVTLIGCGSRGSAGTKTAVSPGETFKDTEQKELACLDLRDHIVALYADDYAEREGITMSESERDAFHSGWAEQVAKKGSFDRFQQSCFLSLTPRRYRCGMASQSTDALVACMKLSAL
jgi:hypothetical protein